MTDSLPRFDEPPVIETVLGVQFRRLENFTNAHAGWFWQEYLNRETRGWPNAKSAARLEDQFEKFGSEVRWGLPSQLRIVSGTESERFQFLQADNERMVQIQDSRFVFNWRKQPTGTGYPSYQKVRHDFDVNFVAFESFVAGAKLGELELNQWEVTYVNHIEKGALWSSFEDWGSKVFRWVPALPRERVEVFPESFRGEWRSVIGDALGRLHVSVAHGRVGVEKEGAEVIRLQLTARGPINHGKGLTMSRGLDLGHETIVRYFAEITSAEAHRHWKRRA